MGSAVGTPEEPGGTARMIGVGGAGVAAAEDSRSAIGSADAGGADRNGDEVAVGSAEVVSGRMIGVGGASPLILTGGVDVSAGVTGIESRGGLTGTSGSGGVTRNSSTSHSGSAAGAGALADACGCSGSADGGLGHPDVLPRSGGVNHTGVSSRVGSSVTGFLCYRSDDREGRSRVDRHRAYAVNQQCFQGSGKSGVSVTCT